MLPSIRGRRPAPSMTRGRARKDGQPTARICEDAKEGNESRGGLEELLQFLL